MLKCCLTVAQMASVGKGGFSKLSRSSKQYLMARCEIFHAAINESLLIYMLKHQISINDFHLGVINSASLTLQWNRTWCDYNRKFHCKVDGNLRQHNEPISCDQEELWIDLLWPCEHLCPQFVFTRCYWSVNLVAKGESKYSYRFLRPPGGFPNPHTELCSRLDWWGGCWNPFPRCK